MAELTNMSYERFDDVDRLYRIPSNDTDNTDPEYHETIHGIVGVVGPRPTYRSYMEETTDVYHAANTLGPEMWHSRQHADHARTLDELTRINALIDEELSAMLIPTARATDPPTEKRPRRKHQLRKFLRPARIHIRKGIRHIARLPQRARRFFSTLLRRRFKPNTNEDPHQDPCVTLPNGTVLAPNIEPAPYYLESVGNAEALERVIWEMYPEHGHPPADTLMIVHAPQANRIDPYSEYLRDTDGIRIVRFGGEHEDTLPVYFEAFTFEALATLVRRTGYMPRLHSAIQMEPAQMDTTEYSDDFLDQEWDRWVHRVLHLPLRDLAQQDLVDYDNGEPRCGICLEDRTVGDEVAELPCGHWYDEDCVLKWVAEKPYCPLCRVPIELKDMVQEEDAVEDHLG